jgi:acyl-CoA synthetase (NDP forming)/GNAT superfamily N-acetyltransferase
MERPPVYALLADGTTVEIRPAVPEDFDAIKAMHEAMSPDNSYLRFFHTSRLSAEIEARRISRNPKPGSVALLALAGREVVGVASYVPLSGQPERAEVAFAVADHMHHRGIATLLLEHLVSLARSRQITTLIANTLTENKAMLGVFADVGLPVERRYAEGAIELTFPLPGPQLPGQPLDSYLDAVAERERRAEVASLRHVFAPESVAVIGASRRPGTVGRAILDNLESYAGRRYIVNPRARQVAGQPCLASALDLPEAVDLAVIAVPAPAVLEVAGQCGQRGVKALVVVTAGLDAAARAGLLAVCRRHGMRLVGPESFGVAVPGIGLETTFSARPARPGVTGLVMQSGGLGLALVDQLSRLGIGISSFASVGDKLDVSGNDMLLWWERDGVTRLAVLYIESFGNPRKFARTARRVSCAMPVLTVLPRGSDTRQEALFEQAGVITTRGFGELVEATALLATQPVPAGRTVAVVSNVGSAGVLAADACADLGLTVHPPVDTSAPVSAGAFRECLERLAPEVHAIVAIVLPTAATGDLEGAIQAANVGVPLAAVVLTQPESVRLLGPVPAYGSPEAAVRALARAAGYGAWRAAPRGQVPALPDVRTADARALTLAAAPGWLGPGQTAELLRCYGIPLADLAPPGPQVTVRVADDHVFGPLVTLEAGEFSRTARLTPLTDADADGLVKSHRPADPGGLRDLLLRVSRLADDLPGVAELELRPVVAGADGAAVIDARVRVAPYQPQDPYLRKLR